MKEQSKINVEYKNLSGDTISLVLVNHRIYFNHSDIHPKDKWEKIDDVNKYVLSEDELKAINGFRLYVNMI